MKDLVQQILKLKPAAKFGITAGLMLIIGVIYNFLVYVDLGDEITTLKNQQQTLTTERASYEKRKVEYLAYRNELLQLQEEQRELLKALPKKAEIPSLLSSISEQGELAGVEVVNLNMEAEVPEELYVRIPIKGEVVGGYHQVVKFFKNLSDLRRIVNSENFTLVPIRVANDDGRTPTRVRTKFVVSTFRYPDKAGGTP